MKRKEMYERIIADGHASFHTENPIILDKKKNTQTHKTNQSHHTIQANWAFKKSQPSSCLQAEQIITLPQGRKVLIKALH